MKNIEHYNLDRLAFDVLTVETPYEYLGETINGVLEIYYCPKHSAEDIKLISIPVPQTDIGFIKGVCYFWLMSDYIGGDFGTRKPVLHNKRDIKPEPKEIDITDEIHSAIDTIMYDVMKDLDDLVFKR